MARLKYAPSALRDLATIRLNIAETTGSEFRAEVVVERIDDRCRTLEFFPFAGRVRPEFHLPTLRSIAIRPNIAFYFYDEPEDVVHIMRIVDGRRDLQTIFFDEI